MDKRGYQSDMLKMLKGKKKAKSRHCHKNKFREYIATRPALQEILKEILQTSEQKHHLESQVYRKEWSTAEMVNKWVSTKNYTL